MKQLQTNKYDMNILKIVGTLAFTGAISLAGVSLVSSPAMALALRGGSPSLAMTKANDLDLTFSEDLAPEKQDTVDSLLQSRLYQPLSQLAESLSFETSLTVETFARHKSRDLTDDFLLKAQTPTYLAASIEKNQLCDRPFMQSVSLCKRLNLQQVLNLQEMLGGDRQDRTKISVQEGFEELSRQTQEQTANVPPQRRGKIGYSYFQDNGIFWLDADVPPPPGARPIAQ